MKATKTRTRCGCCANATDVVSELGVCEACLKHMHDAKWTDAHIRHYYGN